jgi:hypothetical protein
MEVTPLLGFLSPSLGRRILCDFRAPLWCHGLSPRRAALFAERFRGGADNAEAAKILRTEGYAGTDPAVKQTGAG